MDIDRLRYFQVFSETGSLVRAAELIGISQPALSKALKLLESETGLRLLAPEGRGLRLTEAGVRFRDEIAPLLENLLAVPARVRGAGAAAPTRLGSFEVFTTHFLGLLLRFVDLSSLEVHELGPGALEEAIAAGSVDVGITYQPIPKAGVEFTEVTRIRMGVFGAKGFEKSAARPFVIPLPPASGTPSKMVGLDGWPDHRVPREVKFRVEMMESALELCRGGHAVAYLPEFVVRLHNEGVKSSHALHELDCPLPKKDRLQSVFLVRKASRPEGALDRAIAKCLRGL